MSLPYVTTLLFLGLFSTSVAAGWWGIVRGPDLLTRTDNPRRGIADLTIPRGSIYDRNSEPIVETLKQNGDLGRVVNYPSLSPITGYTHPVYGQSGLESSIDPILRGLEGNDPLTIWWNNLLYGQPPAGLDVRLTIDLELQITADQLLQGHTGALVLLNAENGEILVMASHPTYDPNQLEAQWDDLVQDPNSPLVNRATQAIYPIGNLGTFPFIQAALNTEAGSVSLRLPLAVPENNKESTPLEISLGAASLSSMGIRPAPVLVQFMEKPDDGWSLLPSNSAPVELMTAVEADGFLQDLKSDDGLTWGYSHFPAGETITWYMGGTTPEWSGLPMAVVLLIEESNLPLAEDIGQTLLSTAMGQ